VTVQSSSSEDAAGLRRKSSQIRVMDRVFGVCHLLSEIAWLPLSGDAAGVRRKSSQIRVSWIECFGYVIC